jgi:uncharacterized protein with PQ loop repeat
VLPRGVAGNVITLIYYAAPLSSMAEVIKTRNSASILLPMTLMNTLNAALWATYGVVCVECSQCYCLPGSCAYMQSGGKKGLPMTCKPWYMSCCLAGPG